MNASPGPPVSIYVESLDLSRFAGPYEQSLQAHLRLKYQDKPIGAVVAIGDVALDYVSRWRTILMAWRTRRVFDGRRNDHQSVDAYT